MIFSYDISERILAQSLRCSPKEEKVVEMRVNRTSKFSLGLKPFTVVYICICDGPQTDCQHI